jgi:phosphohistidine phosphatase
MRYIYLVRHAKSSWKDKLLSDRQRPLNKRGKENAPMMAERLKERDGIPELIVSSPAKRAQMTANTLAAVIGYDSEQITTDERLYFQDMDGILEVIQDTPETANSVMIVGHNPDMTDLLNLLAGHVTGNMPTCAIATILIKGKWKDVRLGMADLVDYDFPKKDLV